MEAIAEMGESESLLEGFRRERVTSERYRSLVFATVLAAIGSVLIVGALSGATSALLDTTYRGLRIYQWVLVVCFCVVAYELFVWRALKGRRLVPTAFPYTTTLVEMMLPTALLGIFALAMDPTYALVAPPLLVYAILTVLAALHLSERVCVFAGLVAAAHYAVLHRLLVGPYDGPQLGTFLTESWPHFMRGVSLFAIGVVAAFVTWDIKKRLLRSFALEAEKKHVFALLGEQVSPQVAEALVRDGGAGTLRRVCILFLDVRGFTTLAERKTPQETVEFLNILFEPMIRAVHVNDGIINKFLGDGFMAVFGPPFTEGSPSIAAVAAARQIVDELERDAKAGRRPQARVGIGLHTGDAVTGNIGSRLRKEYTVIGDVVNVAARIEQLNKTYDAQILISEDVWRELDPPPAAAQERRGVQVKGREAPLTVYQLA